MQTTVMLLPKRDEVLQSWGVVGSVAHLEHGKLVPLAVGATMSSCEPVR